MKNNFTMDYFTARKEFGKWELSQEASTLGWPSLKFSPVVKVEGKSETVTFYLVSRMIEHEELVGVSYQGTKRNGEKVKLIIWND